MTFHTLLSRVPEERRFRVLLRELRLILIAVQMFLDGAALGGYLRPTHP